MTRRANSAVASAAVTGLLALAAASASAQTGNLGLVVRDGSIGPPVVGDGVVPPGDGASYLITPELGEQSGSNLFHSFEFFGIGLDESARFTTKGDTTNILSRVTGGDASELLGRLESPGASLFLLNPFGVVFGEDATVDVNGSFHVSTADQLNFESGAPFLARESTPPVSLSSAPPASFGFLTDAPADIELQGSRLCGSTPSCVPEGEVLSLIGGNVTVRGRNDSNEALEVDGGRIQIVSVAKAGVEVPLDARALDVESYAPGSFGRVRFANSAVLDVNSGQSVGTGRIVIRAGRFVMEGGGLNATNRGDVDGESDAVDIAVTNDIEIGESETGRRTTILLTSSGEGRTGDLRLAGERVVVKEGARVIAQTTGEADGASLFFDANEIDVVGTGPGNATQTQIYARANGASGGSSGSISLSGRGADAADEIDIRDGAQVFTTANRASSGGNLGFAAQSFALSNGAQIFSEVSEDATGGVIDIDTGDATVSGDSLISSETTGTQTGASIVVTADSLDVRDGGAITSLAGDDASGDGGAIGVTATRTTVTDRGRIAGENRGLGTGGAIDVVAVESLSVTDEGQITTTNRSDATAEATTRRGGDLRITAGLLEIEAGDGAVAVAQVSTITGAEGKPGTDEGRGGDLSVDIEALRLREGGQLRSVTDGSAAAGTLHVVADSIEIDGAVNGGALPSGIFATSGFGPGTSATGAGGSLTIQTRTLDIENGGEASTTTFGTGSAGDIDIVATERVTVRGSEVEESLIASRGAGGPGGNVDIEAPLVELLNGGAVTASANDTGDSGSVRILADNLRIDGENFAARSGVFAQTNSGRSDAGDAGSIRLTVSESASITNRGIVSVKTRGGGTAGDITFDGGGAIEVSDGGEISAVSEGLITPPVGDAIAAPGDAPEDFASDIRIVDASDLLVTREGRISAETFGSGVGGRVDVTAQNIRIEDGGIVSAQSVSARNDAGAAGRIDLAAVDGLDLRDGRVTTETREGEGGSIRLSGGKSVTIDRGSVVSASSTGGGNAGDVVVADTNQFELKGESTITAETEGSGAGGQIVFENVDEVLVTGGSRITTKSSGQGAGDAGSIAIAANESFQLDENSEVTTTADDAGGGRISIQAGKLVYLLDSKLETTVQGDDDVAGADAGDIDIRFRGDEPTETPPETPEFVVINRSTVRANAVATDAGNISIAGRDVLISNDSIIEATSETGLQGEIQITAPDADVVSQVTPLTTAFVDPGDRLLPPCAARTERTGSFIVQNRAANQPSPDSPLAPGLGTSAGAGAGAAFDAGDCPIPEEGS